MANELPKKYNSKETEQKWSQYWLDNQTYYFQRDNVDKPIYSIDSPPPTVSGRLHIGHAYGATIMDFVARYKRFRGFNVLLPQGTDDNGLPTQRLVEKLKKVKSQYMSRTEFVDLCNKTLNEELRPKYIQDFKNWGISSDWSINYSTIDPHCRKISQKSFIELYELGRAYRNEAPTMWCTTCQTAISQVELEDKEMDSIFNDIIFKTTIDGIEEDLIVATTRPELLSACVAIFYNPEDERYKKYKGKMAKVPLFNFEVPILEDEKAEIEKGTGLVMCCTFGDQTDAEWQKKHNLPIKAAITNDGKMSSLATGYEGLKIKEARDAIIEKLKEENLLTNQKEIKHEVNVHERCGTPIEFVHSKQWFIKYLDLKEDMLNWAKEFNWIPEFFVSRYNNWANGLNWDWCISRQIHFGIPFPVWYCKDCDEVILANINDLPVDPTEDKAPVDCCPNCKSKNIVPEKDIINTWATSSLTPTIVKEKLKDNKTYNLIVDKPMDLRIEGHDIISFWLFNTIIKSKLHHNLIPWKNAINTGWILDQKGKKMSKSKGNVVEPTKIMDKFSVDTFRYFAGCFKVGYDINFNEKELINGQKTITKLFNATKFALIHLKDYNLEQPNKFEAMDLWLLEKLNILIEETTKYLDNYEFSKALSLINNFFWKDLCDNYLEISKDRLYNPDTRGVEEQLSAKYTLYNVFKNILKLYAIYIPFITEELYNSYFIDFEKIDSLHKTKWPEKLLLNDTVDLDTANEIVKIVNLVRNYKASQNKSLKTEIELLKINTNKDYTKFTDDLKSSTKTINIEIVENLDDFNIEEDNIKLNIKLVEDIKKE